MSARYAASREKAAEQLLKDGSTLKPEGNITVGIPHTGINSTAYVNGGGTNGLGPKIREVLDTNGSNVLREERNEGTTAGNVRLRTRVNGSVR